MHSFISQYFERFSGIKEKIEVTNNFIKHKLPFENAIIAAVQIISRLKKKNNKIIFIGNGGSAAISSHQAVDYWKNGAIPAITFNDSSLLTCIANDCGFENIFSRSVAMFTGKGDVVICISSSGRSKNIINGAREAKKTGCKIFTFSGFDKNNPLRKLGDLNFYVPSNSYGFVEIYHLLIIHA